MNQRGPGIGVGEGGLAAGPGVNKWQEQFKLLQQRDAALPCASILFHTKFSRFHFITVILNLDLHI
eukprot:SAG31_NODE_28781_length_405_cov_0.816993_1_plen_66_part_00